jgi:hypothetical protein
MFSGIMAYKQSKNTADSMLSILNILPLVGYYKTFCLISHGMNNIKCGVLFGFLI